MQGLYWGFSRVEEPHRMPVPATKGMLTSGQSWERTPFCPWRDENLSPTTGFLFRRISTFARWRLGSAVPTMVTWSTTATSSPFKLPVLALPACKQGEHHYRYSNFSYHHRYNTLFLPKDWRMTHLLHGPLCCNTPDQGRPPRQRAAGHQRRCARRFSAAPAASPARKGI